MVDRHNGLVYLLQDVSETSSHFQAGNLYIAKWHFVFSKLMQE